MGTRSPSQQNADCDRARAPWLVYQGVWTARANVDAVVQRQFDFLDPVIRSTVVMNVQCKSGHVFYIHLSFSWRYCWISAQEECSYGHSDRQDARAV